MWIVGVHLFAQWPVHILEFGGHAIRDGQGAHFGVKVCRTQALPLCHKRDGFLWVLGFQRCEFALLLVSQSAEFWAARKLP